MNKYKELVNYFVCCCGFSRLNAIKELERIIRYHTTGVDAVSRAYAIEMLYAEICE